MLATLFTWWGLKMAAYVAVVLGLCVVIDRRGKDRDYWKRKWEDATAAALTAKVQVNSLQEDIRAWKAQGEAAKILAAAAKNDAIAAKERFEALAAKVREVDSPDAAWLVMFAQDLKKEARE